MPKEQAVSAAGIFQSNLRDEFVQNLNQQMFERAFGAIVLAEIDHYAATEANSVQAGMAVFNAVFAV